MRANLDLTVGAVMAEAIMMALAEALGRHHAHEIVHQAAATAATSGENFTDVIARAPAITSRWTPSQVHALLDPVSHIGHSADIARQTAARTRSQLETRADETRRRATT